MKRREKLMNQAMDFVKIYDAHYTSVWAYIHKMVKDNWVADDLAQDTFIRVRSSLDMLKDESKLKSWIFRIARNLCLDHFRRKKDRCNYRNNNDIAIIAIQPMAQFQLEQYQMSQCVQDKISLLPELLRDVLTLSETCSLKHHEIAEILETSPGNIKVRLHRARKALKKILERDCTFDHDERNVMVCHPASTT